MANLDGSGQKIFEAHRHLQTVCLDPTGGAGSMLGTTVSSEAELARMLRSLQRDGEDTTLAQIIELTWAGVFRLARSRVGDEETAKDLTQEVFVTFSKKYGGIRDAGRLRSWLYGVTLRKARSWRRNPQQTLLDPDMLDLLIEESDRDSSPLALLCEHEETAEREAILNAACAALSPRLRECVRLIWVENCSRTEAAARMGVSVETIWQYLSRAVAQIAEHIKSSGSK